MGKSMRFRSSTWDVVMRWTSSQLVWNRTKGAARKHCHAMHVWELFDKESRSSILGSENNYHPEVWRIVSVARVLGSKDVQTGYINRCRRDRVGCKAKHMVIYKGETSRAHGVEVQT